MWSALKKSVIGLVGSKKAIVAGAATLGCLVACKTGMCDAAKCQETIKWVVLTWLGAQGLSDFGKGKSS